MSRYGLNQTVAPTVEPVFLADVKQHLRITTSDLDAEIQLNIRAAVRYWERVHGRQFINATYVQTWRNFRVARDDDNIIRLARRPLSSVSSITYVDTAGDTQTWNASLYDKRTSTYFGEIEPAFNESYPSDVRSASESVAATYVAGYGASVSSVPEEYQQGLMLWVEYLMRDDPKSTADIRRAAMDLMNFDVAMVV